MIVISSTLIDCANPSLQALVSCLELLEHENVDTRVCACKALACLRVGLPVPSARLRSVSSHHIYTCVSFGIIQAKESIDQLVYVCRTDKEDVREAAKQTLLVLGEVFMLNSLFSPLTCVLHPFDDTCSSRGAGEEGKMAYRHVETSQDTIPRFFTAGSMASTAF